jgi:hypothetical protein
MLTNRTIGQPNKITTIFGRKVTKQYKGKLQTVIEDLELPNPVDCAEEFDIAGAEHIEPGTVMVRWCLTKKVLYSRVDNPTIGGLQG